MSSPPLLPLLLLFAVASAGPLEVPEGAQAAQAAAASSTPSAATTAAAKTPAPAAEDPAEQAVPAATLAPPAEGQYCTVEGAVFHNGARLPLSAGGPGGRGGSDPCRPCYCQGGEAVCTRVHCYRRLDCAPRHVPGSCCPKYDNCPPAPEDRAPEPRFKEASTQTDEQVSEASSSEAVTTDATTATSRDEPTEGTESTDTPATTMTTTTTTTDSTMTTSTAPSTTTTGSTESVTTTREEEEDAAEQEASGYPPGIDLHALHEHLPFLSPGDANGPNT